MNTMLKVAVEINPQTAIAGRGSPIATPRAIP
jgi:hypothetical protein